MADHPYFLALDKSEMNTELRKHVKTPEEAEAEEDVSLLVQLTSNVTTKAPEKK